MSENTKYFDLNDLYKILKKHDSDILKHFCDENLSDDDYFFYGINSDIFSNALNVLTNYLSNNLESAGVDQSCRTIIEAMVVLKMDAAGNISNAQKRIYRYHYPFVDLDNFHSLLKDKNDEMDDLTKNRLEEDKAKSIQAMIEHFGCKEKDLKKRDISIDDPCFYLKDSLKNDVKFSKLLKKYPVGNQEDIKMYDFFSLFIHPRCEMNLQTEEAIMKVRKVYVDNVLDYVFHYLMNSKLLCDTHDLSDFNTDFFYNPLLYANVHNVKEIEKTMMILQEKLCKLPDGDDIFSWQFIEKMKYLVIDMMISMSLGYKEHVIALFKPFIEEYSIYFAIGSVESQRDFDYVKRGYWLSSRIQFDEYFKALNLGESIIPENEIETLYNEYYNEKYKLDDYVYFNSELKRNSLFFLENERKSYNKYVRNAIQTVFTDEEISKEVMTVYRISKDMSHASGYNFNASEGIVDVTCHKVMLFCWNLINFYIISAAATLEEHGVTVDFNPIVELFKSLTQMSNDALLEIYQNKHE